MRKPWALLIVLAVLGGIAWCEFSLPRYQLIDLSIDQGEAVAIAKDYLTKGRGFNIDGYKEAVAFNVDNETDRYLQKTIGTQNSKEFLDSLNYDLFSWVIRFTKEKQKEEFKVYVSSKTGEVIGFSHPIENTAARPTVDRDKAHSIAVDFLKRTFGFDPDQYILRNDEAKKWDHRVDHSFTFESKHVNIPWDKKYEGGNAKFLSSIIVSGDDVLFFYKGHFDIPEGFSRYVYNLKQTGQNLILIFRILYLALLTFAIMVVVNRKGHLAPRTVKPFYVKVGIFVFIVLILDIFNNFQDVLFAYPTPQTFNDYVINEFIQKIISPFFLIVALILPGLAGESLRFENTPDKKDRGLIKPVLSSFFTLQIAEQICIGYFLAAIILGAQSIVFHLGYQFCGVWNELSWMTQTTTSVLPAFTALMIGVQASFSEEIMFRLFAINFLKKYGFASVLAVFVSAVIWGFGHTGYEVYPMWFRGIEVSCLGLILGYAYLRFGFITVVVAHFLMDAFLVSMPYLLKAQPSFDFYSSLLVVAIPLVWAGMCCILKRSSEERPWVPDFNPQQHFNYGILKELCVLKTPEQLKVLKKELLQHGWDPAIVERVFKQER